jgi:hypothetical protein
MKCQFGTKVLGLWDAEEKLIEPINNQIVARL